MASQPKLIAKILEDAKSEKIIGETMPTSYCELLYFTQEYNPHALSVFDGRYGDQSKLFAGLFTEANYTNYRYWAEIAWLKCALTHYSGLPQRDADAIQWQSMMATIDTLEEFELRGDELAKIHALEATTKHDVKAIELFIKDEKLRKYHPTFKYFEWVHICLTSQDINSFALAKMIVDFKHMFVMACKPISDKMREFINGDKIVMLAHTHGQPAVPTTLNKEFAVHHARMFGDNPGGKAVPGAYIQSMPVHVKFGGAIGSWAAGCFAFPEHSPSQHIAILNGFITDNFPLRDNVSRTAQTTQVDNYTWIVNMLNTLTTFCEALLGCANYIRALIHDEYIVQSVISTETGSSTMPQKVNPIYFENVKANAEFAIATFNTVSRVLMGSEYQRDMSDSTALRSLATGMGYLNIVMCTFYEGLTRIRPNPERIKAHLLAHPEVIMEAVQTVCRVHNYAGAYEKAKDFIRHVDTTTGVITLESIREHYISKLDIPEEDKARLMALTLEEYIGFL